MFSRLYWLSHDITGDEEKARDIVQECYSVLWNSHRDISPSDITPYLFTCVRNASLKYVHDQHMFAAVPIDFLAEEEPLASEGNWREREEKVRAVEQVIRRLQPKAREMLSLKYRQGMTYKEIAEQTGSKIETVRKTLYRTMKLIRTQINANIIEKKSTPRQSTTSNNI